MKLFANTLTDKDVIKHIFQEKKNKDKDRAHYVYTHARSKRTYVHSNEEKYRKKCRFYK